MSLAREQLVGPLSRKTILDYKGLTDTELVTACKWQDHKAFEHLVKKYERIVERWLYQLAPDCVDTADLVQEVFIRVWRSIGTLQNTQAFRSWLHQIATNIFRDQLRHKPKLQIISIDSPIFMDNGDQMITRDIADHSGIADTLCERQELVEAIRVAIGRLPDHYRTALVLRELNGLPYQDIARITQTEIGTVKSRICRARRNIQQSLEGYLRG